MVLGSIGLQFMGGASSPSRVFQNKNLPGHLGAVKVTTQNLTIVSVNAEKNVILVKGAVPGPNGALVSVVDSVKNSAEQGIRKCRRLISSTWKAALWIRWS